MLLVTLTIQTHLRWILKVLFGHEHRYIQYFALPKAKKHCWRSLGKLQTFVADVSGIVQKKSSKHIVAVSAAFSVFLTLH